MGGSLSEMTLPVATGNRTANVLVVDDEVATCQDPLVPVEAEGVPRGQLERAVEDARRGLEHAIGARHGFARSHAAALRFDLQRPALPLTQREVERDRLFHCARHEATFVRRIALRLAAVAGLTLTFYPVVKAFTLGQKELGEFLPGTASLYLTVGTAPDLGIADLLSSLDRYPYGCAEQITSRALPLLYLNDVARAVGIAADSELRKRVQTGISGVLAKQTSSGAFGLWGPRDGDEDLWLDAYVTDFLLRADQAGYELPAVGKTLAIDNLANKVAIAKDFTNGGTDIAYALYVLARAGRAQIGDLRYYAESKLNAFATPLAKAQIGAALALYGDKVRAETAFRAAVTEVRASRADAGYREDYGSTLRDSAAILTLAAETAQSSVDVRTLAGDVATLRNGRRYLSTQEESWMLLAAAAMIKDLQRPSLTLDGLPFEGSLFRRFDGAAVRATPVVIANAGSQVVDALITASGVPTVAPPASGNGFKIERAYFRTDGKPANVATVGQNERFVVTVTVTADRGVGGRLMIVDPLPAGFEIENPNLSASGDTATYDWLDADTEVAHTEARTATMNCTNTLIASRIFTVRSVEKRLENGGYQALK